jgi:hypothetical protein
MQARALTAALGSALLCSVALGVPTGTSLPQHQAEGGAASRVLVVDGRRGHDDAEGTHLSPLRSVGEAACRAVEREKLLSGDADSAGWQRWTIELNEGIYPGLSEHDVRCFGAGAPLTVAARAGERVVMTAGIRIPNSAFKPTGSGGALSASLPTVAGGLGVGSYGVVSDCSSRIEASMNGGPLILARWPNLNATSGYNEWGSVLSVENQEPNAAFTIATEASSSCSNPATTDQLSKWAKESDLWTHGEQGVFIDSSHSNQPAVR